MAHILVVDDDEGVRSFVAEALELRQHRVSAASSSEEALLMLEKQHFDLLITDLKMPGAGGMALLAEVRKVWPHMGALVLTACGTTQNALKAIHLGAHGFLRKPLYDLSTLYRIVNRALFESQMPALP